MNCLLCHRALTFVSTKKKSTYKYCKKCFHALKNSGRRPCGCGSGFDRKCIWSDCDNLTDKCNLCQTGWIDEYCSWCQ